MARSARGSSMSSCDPAIAGNDELTDGFLRPRALYNVFKEWVEQPLNLAFFLWLLSVGAGLLLLGLLMSGALDHLFADRGRRKDWEDADNQILNALFTVLCLYEHPALLHHLVLAIRWTPEDAARLRLAYCKRATPRRRDRAHLLLVLALLHVTCLAQYALFGLYLGYDRHDRPAGGVLLCIVVGICCPVAAAVYIVCGFLGRKRGVASAETTGSEMSATRKAPLARPGWAGGMFDCREDPAVAWLSLSCTFCVFGWNMERLGFGNRFVHAARFGLLCVSPFLAFAAASRRIESEVAREVVAGVGVALSVLGLLYGGIWRIKMRTRFGLPESRWCLGHAGMTDCVQWLLCWPCALAQEVRTGSFYEVGEDGFYDRKVAGGAASEAEIMQAPPQVVVAVEL